MSKYERSGNFVSVAFARRRARLPHRGIPKLNNVQGLWTTVPTQNRRDALDHYIECEEFKSNGNRYSIGFKPHQLALNIYHYKKSEALCANGREWVLDLIGHNRKFGFDIMRTVSRIYDNLTYLFRDENVISKSALSALIFGIAAARRREFGSEQAIRIAQFNAKQYDDDLAMWVVTEAMMEDRSAEHMEDYAVDTQDIPRIGMEHMLYTLIGTVLFYDPDVPVSDMKMMGVEVGVAVRPVMRVLHDAAAMYGQVVTPYYSRYKDVQGRRLVFTMTDLISERDTNHSLVYKIIDTAQSVFFGDLWDYGVSGFCVQNEIDDYEYEPYVSLPVGAPRIESQSFCKCEGTPSNRIEHSLEIRLWDPYVSGQANDPTVETMLREELGLSICKSMFGKHIKSKNVSVKQSNSSDLRYRIVPSQRIRKKMGYNSMNDFVSDVLLHDPNPFLKEIGDAMSMTLVSMYERLRNMNLNEGVLEKIKLSGTLKLQIAVRLLSGPDDKLKLTTYFLNTLSLTSFTRRNDEVYARIATTHVNEV